MNSLRTTKLASLFATFTAFVALGTSGCYLQAGVQGTDTTTTVSGPAEPPPVADPVATVATVSQVSIDPGATMSASPGDGVGLYVEYAGAGRWNVFTTCDTATSGASCAFDIVVTPEAGSALSSVQGQELETGDTFTLLDDGSVQLRAETSFGMNGFSFDTDPGAMIELDMLLDGVAQPRFVYAVSGGALLDGVDTNPVDFIPAAP